MWRPMQLSGWGGTHRSDVLASRPEKVADVTASLADAGSDTLIARGAGRSYGDEATNDGGRVLLTERLNRILSFDDASGVVVCEPGVTYQDLLDVFLSRGFIAPVTPGTAHTTMGGAVANDVHGKNHDRVGSFGDHVRWLDLMLPSGEICRMSQEERPELFTATIGGLGLTGIILAVCFTMQRVPSAWVEVHEQRIPDLDAFMTALEDSRASATYSVGWIDGLASGNGFGRGILRTAEPVEAPASGGRRRTGPSVPFSLPLRPLRPLTVKLFNAAYLRLVPAKGRTRTLRIEPFFYPLDAIGHWNRIYGSKGFFQFQCVIPDAQAGNGIPRLMEEIVRSRAASFLDVLKTLGSPGKGLLSFPLRGYTLAMDLPNTPEAVALLSRLEQITLEHEGRVYLGKDALMSQASFEAMYPRHAAFRTVLADVDPEGRMSSDLARRVGLRP